MRRMPTWRCPHCGTPQQETARCWVCRRSSTACGTWRHFRRSVAAQLGYCGLDRRRTPLAGDEIRGCWEGATPEAVSPGVRVGGSDRAMSTERAARLDFIEIDGGRGIGSTPAPAAPDRAMPAAPPRPTAPALPPLEPGWSLWGDFEG